MITTSPLQVELDVAVRVTVPLPKLTIQLTPFAPDVAVTVADASCTSPTLEPNVRKP